ncbi:MAG: aminopeptidase N [Microbacterium sp.]|nr:aminopeptidase N [Microbacterium sp.]
MPGENLTRAEAIERARVVAVDSYAVVLDLTDPGETFESTTTIRFRATPGASTFVDFVHRELRIVTLNGVALDPDAVSEGRVRVLIDDLAAENELVISGLAEYTNSGEGLHKFIDPVDEETYLYSQFEVPDARRMYATFEQPDLKATFQLTVAAPAKWKVVSNQPSPDPEPVTTDTARWAFEPTPRISVYLTALIAGPYHEVRDELVSADGRTIPLGIFCRASLAGYLDPAYLFEITKKGFAFYEALFDYPYPFAKYDQLFVPEFNAGAMENVGAVTFTETYVFRSKVTDAIKERRVVTILHELAHMWFGDLVTMKWWNDLWLNESFAEFISTLATAEATEWTEAWTTFAAMEKSWAYRQDQLPSTHPIVATINDLEDVQVNFDGITYAKGGSVLKQLVAYVGRDRFVEGVRRYFREHAFSNTELKDLLAELEAASGRDLADWSAKWLETAGVNTLRPELETDAYGVITSVRVLQTAPADYPTIRPHRLVIGSYDLRDGALARVGRVELDVDGARTEVPELAGERAPLILINDEDLAYAKVRMDPESLEVAIEHLAEFRDALPRTLVWGSVWDATRDAEVPGRDYVRLVLGNIGAETESTTVRTTLTQLLQTARTYVDPATRSSVLAEIGAALWRLAQDAADGSDNQFQFVKFLANVASDNELDVLQGLFDGSLELAGLPVDTDLKWELLDGLVLGGRAGEAEISAMLTSDPTASGEQSAARARATIPTSEAKLAAFSRVVDRSDAPNLIVRNTGLGFLHVNHASVLEPVVEKYFGALTRIWTSRSYHIAETLVMGFYPSPIANRSLLDSTRAWLDANPGIPALRRLVSENAANVERALAAQARDAQES